MRRAAALAFALLLAGCAAPGPPTPFQKRSEAIKAYGYSEVKLDSTHYAVSYSDNNEKSADGFLELRAAQLAQGAGFHYFIFDQRNNVVVREIDNDLNFDDVVQHGATHGVPNQTRDFIPRAMHTGGKDFFYAWGQEALLTDDQAKANAKAIQVAEVLARPGAVAAP
jgi:hypothetical protein